MKGFTLLELLVVVAMLAIFAAVALPSLAPIGPEKVEAAAQQVAEALRFARDETLRSGEIHGVQVQLATGRVTVYRSSGALSPPYLGTILYHPVSKQPFDFFLAQGSLTAGVTIANNDAPFRYRGSALYWEDLLFAPAGNPTHLSSGTTSQLQSGQIKLNCGGYGKTVVVHPITGRVTIP